MEQGMFSPVTRRNTKEVIEFCSNFSTADTDDTTSFAYGPKGSRGILGQTNLSVAIGRRKRVQWGIPYLPDNGDYLMIQNFNGVGWGDVNQIKMIVSTFYYPIQALGVNSNQSFGMGYDILSAYQADIIFGRYPMRDESIAFLEWSDAGFVANPLFRIKVMHYLP